MIRAVEPENEGNEPVEARKSVRRSLLSRRKKTETVEASVGFGGAEAAEAPKQRRAARKSVTEEVAEAVAASPVVSEPAPQEAPQGEAATGEQAPVAATEPAVRRGTSRLPRGEYLRAKGQLPPAQAETAAPQEGASATAEASATSPAAAVSASEPIVTKEPAEKKTTRRNLRKSAETAAGGPAAPQSAETAPAPLENSHAEDAITQLQQDLKGELDEKAANRDRALNRNRARQRDRKRRPDEAEFEVNEEEALVPVAGILDVLESYAFVRTSSYEPCENDVYVSLSQVKRYGLRRGDALMGYVRDPREMENTNRQKYNALVRLELVNGMTPEEAMKRPRFEDLTAIAPVQAVRLKEGGAPAQIAHSLDTLAPLALGQCGLMIHRVPAGNSKPLLTVVDAVRTACPTAHTVLMLIGSPADRITYFKRNAQGADVISAPADKPCDEQVGVFELGIDRVRRMVELGHDVVLYIDSLQTIASAIQTTGFTQNRTHRGQEFERYNARVIRRILAIARNIENGGSLTILANVSDRYAQENWVDFEELVNWKCVVDSYTPRKGEPVINVYETESSIFEQEKSEALVEAIRVFRQNDERREDTHATWISREDTSFELTNLLAKNPDEHAFVNALNEKRF